MNIAILMGGPRIHGNTAELSKPFIQELLEQGEKVQYRVLEELNIQPCMACYACQDVDGEYGCVQKDDMHGIVADILWADVIML